MAFHAYPIRTTGSTLIGSANGGGILWTVNVNTGASSAVLKIYDGTDATGTLIATIDASSKSSHVFGAVCNRGIYIDLSGGNADCTIGCA